MTLETERFDNIPENIREIINTEIAKSILPLLGEDPETAEMDAEFETDYKESQYLLLEWLKNKFITNKILYAGSGFDILPKLVFGEDKIFHTSLENYDDDKDQYFPELGFAIKIIADNVDQPFPDSSFDMVMFFGLCIDSTIEQLLEASRVLAKDGLIVCDDTITSSIDVVDVIKGFEEIKVPVEFQNRGISETSFAVFKKL